MNYVALCELSVLLERTRKRLQKTAVLAAFLRDVPLGELPCVVLLVQGLVYPAWDERKLGFSSQYVLRALALSAGVSVDAVKDLWREKGDLGECAFSLVGKKKQSTLFSQQLTIQKVFANLQSLASMGGEGSVDAKIGLVVELLSCATALEAKFVVRTVLDEMRVGLGEGTLRDALVWAFLPGVLGISTPFDKEMRIPSKTLVISTADELASARLSDYKHIYAEDDKINRAAYDFLCDSVQRALDYSNDFGEVACILKKNGLTGLTHLKLVPGKPVNAMLALKEQDVAGAFERVGTPAAVEYKLDGFRMQVHKTAKGIVIFTRRLENVTRQFPDVVAAVEKYVKGKQFILDSEAVGVDKKTGTFLPFQNISQRIRRKYDIESMAHDFPVVLYVFDILSLDGKNLLEEPFLERRRLLGTVVKVSDTVQLITQLQTSDEKEAQRFFEKSLALGNEGVMFKTLDAPYQPGARVGYMVKLKTTMETLDLVIVSAEWGEGKRSAWLSSYEVACRDEKTGELLVVGWVSTGLKEKKEEGLCFADLTDLLQPLVVEQKGRAVTVKPQVVIEVTYEEIQKSSGYGSGFALRFPRVVRLREDRDAATCSALADVQRLFGGQ